jgi:glycerol-3-phosphate dehydrogenase subunit B
MWSGVQALRDNSRCLLVDFDGMKDFSARQIAASIQDTWPQLRTLRITFPDAERGHEVFTGLMARALEVSRNRDKLVQLIRPHIKDAVAVGLPAILGLKRTPHILSDMKEKLGVAVFEIPTMPTSVPGQRLKDTFESHLSDRKGIRLLLQQEVLEASPLTGGGFRLGIGNHEVNRIINTRNIILASGRFLGQGLYAQRKRIRESIFDLPVYQPDSRSQWHRKDFLDPRGHEINHSGLDVDEYFRPINVDGEPVFNGLYAAGSILAHQDWMRMKCGSGVAIATAYGAVQSYLKQKG